MYADYVYYSDKFGGTIIPKCEYDRCAEEASDYIDYITNGKAASYTGDKVKRCCCKMAEAYSMSMKASSGGNIASETVGSYSVSYRSSSELEAEIKAKFFDICRTMFANTGLLYRGINVRSTHCNDL